MRNSIRFLMLNFLILLTCLTSLAQEPQDLKNDDDTYIVQGDTAKRSGYLVGRPNYQFYQERVELSYNLESRLDSINSNCLPDFEIKSHFLDIGIGISIGLVVGLFIAHH